MTSRSWNKRALLAASVVGVLGVALVFAACNKTPSGSAEDGGQDAKAKIKLPPPPDAGDTVARVWKMFGGSPSRNMVNTVERNMPVKWNHKTGENIKWSAQLGSKSYGNPVVSGGKLFLGTNNENARNPRDTEKKRNQTIPIDRGILMCFREADGKFLWQAVHDKLASGRVNDWPEEGICSSPYVDGDRVYYVSNRCELVCADVEGFYNGNQGAQDEKYKTETDADFIWRLDMMEELGVFPHNLAVCCPLVIGDIVYVVTGNGHDESHDNIPNPNAPSFIAVDKKTGKVLWQDNSPGEKIYHGQWSNPAYGEINGQPQIIFPGGDGWLYAFEPKAGKLIWKFDCNPKKAGKYVLGSRGTRNEIISTPVVYENRVYVAVGQDPEHGEGVGHLWCVDPAKAAPDNIDLSPVNDNLDPKADVNKKSGLVWHHGGIDQKGEMVFRRTMSTCAVHDGICYAANLSGFLDVLDAKTGALLWRHDCLTEIWGSPYVVDGKVYLGTEQGDVLVFQQGRDKKLLAKNDMTEPVLSTPVAVNGVLYVMGRSKLWAIAPK